MSLYVLFQLNKLFLVSLEVFLLHVRVLTLLIVLKIISIHGFTRFKRVQFTLNQLQLLFVGPFIDFDQIVNE